MVHCELCEAEIWKQHKEFPYYWISNLGRVKSITKNGNERIKSAEITNRGYERTLFCTDGVRKHQSIHRLVAEYFLSPSKIKDTVNHKDFNKLNNNVCNLEWLTYSQNCQHASDADRNFKRPVIQMSLDGDFIKEWRCAYHVELEIGYFSTHISNCCRGGKKTYKQFKWKFKNG
jgi:hypothetical protein